MCEIVFCNGDIRERRDSSGEGGESHPVFGRISTLMDELGGSMFTRGVVELVLHDLEELDGYRTLGIVVDTGRIEIENLAVESFFTTADITDTIEKLFPVVASSGLFESLVIHSKSFFDVFFEDVGRPDPEVGCLFAVDAISDGDDSIEIVKFCLIVFTIGGSMFQNGTN